MIYVERRTATAQGEVVVRDPVESVRDALILIYRLITEGHYVATTQYSHTVKGGEGIYPSMLMPDELQYPSGCLLRNDVTGGFTLLCWREYSEAQPEGVVKPHEKRT